jgi:hypothetical protein
MLATPNPRFNYPRRKAHGTRAVPWLPAFQLPPQKSPRHESGAVATSLSTTPAEKPTARERCRGYQLNEPRTYKSGPRYTLFEQRGVTGPDNALLGRWFARRDRPWFQTQTDPLPKLRVRRSADGPEVARGPLRMPKIPEVGGEEQTRQVSGTANWRFALHWLPRPASKA